MLPRRIGFCAMMRNVWGREIKYMPQELVQRMIELEQQAAAVIESAEREAARIFEAAGLSSRKDSDE